MAQHKKKADLAKSETRERFNIQAGANNADHPLDTKNRVSGDSVDEHRRLESANAYLAEKEIKQTFLNS
ncbi:hypothetical protein [Oceanobacillus senegalensis]|uniref:hypothetical protein n=1 Tax=Oceanobacillus senegalensis TaxID=1936063 RepID=UPI000A305670|nr:hypothetical protein [Oceanobacillus senegalensis]